MSFSERFGLKKKKEIQIESMDDGLKIRIWNCIVSHFLCDFQNIDYIIRGRFTPKINFVVYQIWGSFFKDEVNPFLKHRVTRDHLNLFRIKYNQLNWNEVYDLIEFVLERYHDEKDIKRFIMNCDEILREENSAYRFINKQLCKVTSEVEINEIKKAIKNDNDIFKHVSTHIKAALQLFSDRENPDYRNSIKESIRAVESMCNLITGEKKSTLGQAIKKIENKFTLHPALMNAFSNLYGWTSDTKTGIRHGLMDDPNLEFEEAKFMSIICSAFVNYLKEKVSRGQIELNLNNL